MNETSMYWITRLDGIRILLNNLAGVCCLVFVAGVIFWIVAACFRMENERYNNDDHDDSDWKKYNAIANKAKHFVLFFLALSIALSVAHVFIPTTREIVAIKVVPAIASPEMCEKIKDVSNDFVDVAAGWLKDVKAGDKERKGK